MEINTSGHGGALVCPLCSSILIVPGPVHAGRPLPAQLAARLPASHTPCGLLILPALSIHMVLFTGAN